MGNDYHEVVNLISFAKAATGAQGQTPTVRQSIPVSSQTSPSGHSSG